MSGFFIFLAILAAFSFSLQWALTTKFSRDGDALTIATCRGLALGISMLPLLCFSNIENILLIVEFEKYLIPAGLFGALAVWMKYESMESLPVGIQSSFGMVATTLGAILLGFFLFDEKLTFYTLLSICIIVVGGIIISVSKTDFNHLKNVNFFKGIFFALLSGFSAAVSIALMIKVSRELDPFAAGYFWELQIGFASLFILLIRRYFFRGVIEKVSLKFFSKILLLTSPTLIGTGSMALAAHYGPIGVIQALGITAVIFSTIFGIILFKEKLKLLQYFGMLVIMIGILGIKLI